MCHDIAGVRGLVIRDQNYETGSAMAVPHMSGNSDASKRLASTQEAVACKQFSLMEASELCCLGKLYPGLSKIDVTGGA